ncbi:xanthine dehydrogenase accessory protein XdhC [Allobranchiibius sp. GilTou73]|uniref:xanthine dehydrogenase accessory protein XdhC n=1 Tax=Allobranchiibius sp. GilTou73 TaxID=2904523 RepID=UPI001F44555A|nr:xanthine dehydrogenase accessory protein XdhC [Allobranchiibius sp. GilTou73]UIJ35653.1 xanthine dehydrogenase accessory protein XdhC [Allobranchiibius sp. GilTou73]
MHWIDAIARLRAGREPGVLVTLTSVRGHAPREAGAKMVVSAAEEFGTIGGGNLEATAVARARAMLADGARSPQSLELALNERAPVQHGTQCCGGEVQMLFEPLPVVASVAIFGMGHVGVELSRILSRQDLELHLVDSRAAYAVPRLPAVYDDSPATLHWHHSPVPELVLGQVPAGTHVLVMTHDHAEDAALCDTALRCTHLGSIGLIGSSAKWRRFEKRLLEEGHSPESLTRITCPVGIPDLVGKEPATIAVSVAAALLQTVAAEAAAAHPTSRTRT